MRVAEVTANARIKPATGAMSPMSPAPPGGKPTSHPLAGEIGGERAHAGDVAARTRETWDQATAYRVRCGRHHDRDFVSCLLGGTDRRLAPDHQNIDRQARELGCERRKTIEMTVGNASLHFEIAFLGIAEVSHAE
jgi:hypothetical protein